MHSIWIFQQVNPNLILKNCKKNYYDFFNKFVLLFYSTGHMVLSYMESHLKNKGRLQREWEGLQVSLENLKARHKLNN